MFVEQLTARELEVLRLIVAGRSTKQIAFDLGISFKTAACHRSHILQKIGAHNTAELVCRAIREGLIQAAPLPGNGLAPPGRTEESPVSQGPSRHRAALAVRDECRVNRDLLSGVLQKNRSLVEECQSAQNGFRTAFREMQENWKTLKKTALRMGAGEYKVPDLGPAASPERILCFRPPPGFRFRIISWSRNY
jgi:DNA-binding CsgD family transcriptional regulator